jgi:hypothetical protein
MLREYRAPIGLQLQGLAEERLLADREPLTNVIPMLLREPPQVSNCGQQLINMRSCHISGVSVLPVHQLVSGVKGPRYELPISNDLR